MNNKHDINQLKVYIVHLVPLNVERDLHLMTSILGVEHYALIMLGAITVSVEVLKILPLLFSEKSSFRSIQCFIRLGCS